MPVVAGSSEPDFWSDVVAKLAAQRSASKGVVIESKSVANRNPAKGLNEDRIGLWRDDDDDVDGDGSGDGSGSSSGCSSGAWCMAVCDGHGGSDCAE